MKLEHARISIRLHELSPGSSHGQPPLLLLHALGSSACEWSDRWSNDWEVWDGPVHALDFAGHGDSDHARGRSYYPEFFLVEADLALAAIGDRAYIAGAGLGAYVAMLLAGSRPDRVCGALLLPGRGLACRGSRPDFDRRPETIEEWEARLEAAARSYLASTDPFVASCESDTRPTDYVSEFASAARALLFSEAVDSSECEGGSLEWWQVARERAGGGTAPADLKTALRELARQV